MSRKDRALWSRMLLLALGLLLAGLWWLPVLRPAGAQTGWQEVIRTPGGQYGWVSLGRWKRVEGWGAYPCWTGCEPNWYHPVSGPDAYWWTPGYDDAAWSSQGYVDWHNDWDVYGWQPIPAIGKYVWKARDGWPNNRVDLHRRRFTVPAGDPVVLARIHLFSDNHSEWWIDGVRIGVLASMSWTTWNLPPSLLQAGDHLLAVAVYNDWACEGCNPFGIQYLLEVYRAAPTPTPTLPAPAGDCAWPYLVWHGGRLPAPSAGQRITVPIPPDRPDLTGVEIRLTPPAPSPYGSWVYRLPPTPPAVTFSRESTGDPTFGEALRGTWEAWGAYQTVQGYGPWGRLCAWTTFWLPEHLER